MTLRAGIYRHYKGPLYLVLGLAHDANADTLCDNGGPARYPEPLGEREVVVYVPLQLDGAHAGPRMAVRTRSDFDAVVCGQQGCSGYGKPAPGPGRRECDRTHLVRRFAYVSESYDPDPGLLPTARGWGKQVRTSDCDCGAGLGEQHRADCTFMRRLGAFLRE